MVSKILATMFPPKKRPVDVDDDMEPDSVDSARYLALAKQAGFDGAKSALATE